MLPINCFINTSIDLLTNIKYFGYDLQVGRPLRAVRCCHKYARHCEMLTFGTVSNSQNPPITSARKRLANTASRAVVNQCMHVLYLCDSCYCCVQLSNVAQTSRLEFLYCTHRQRQQQRKTYKFWEHCVMLVSFACKYAESISKDILHIFFTCTLLDHSLQFKSAKIKFN
jgi:hypothetical protein